jgi:folylpolyglutamate synthase
LISLNSNPDAVNALTVQKALAVAWQQVVNQKSETHVVKTIEEAVDFVHALDADVHVLVTGSLHLVGGILEVIDPLP